MFDHLKTCKGIGNRAIWVTGFCVLLASRFSEDAAFSYLAIGVGCGFIALYCELRNQRQTPPEEN